MSLQCFRHVRSASLVPLVTHHNLQHTNKELASNSSGALLPQLHGGVRTSASRESLVKSRVTAYCEAKRLSKVTKARFARSSSETILNFEFVNYFVAQVSAENLVPKNATWRSLTDTKVSLRTIMCVLCRTTSCQGILNG